MHHIKNRMCVITKMLKTCVFDDMLRTVEHDDTSFSLDFYRDYYVSTIRNSIEHRCYLIFDRVRGEFVRAGSASAKLRYKDANGIKRGIENGHMKASTKY